MVETIKKSKGWSWAEIMNDLKTKGELDGVLIDTPIQDLPINIGTYKNKKFTFTWKKDHYFLLSMEKDSDSLKELVGGFTKVLAYFPFCKYKENQIFTYEWDMVTPNSRFKELESNHEIRDLEKIIIE